MKEDTQEMWIAIFVAVSIAIAWPWIFPVLDYVMAIISFSSAPSLYNALNEFGPIYGDHPSAPGFFRGMAEASQKLGGENPAIAALPYFDKAKLLLYTSLPIYAIELFVFMTVGILSFSSRLLPWKRTKTVVQIIAIAVSKSPLIAISLWWLFFTLLAYVQAWSASILDFLFLILLLPVVFIKVVSPLVGGYVLARYVIPSGLAFAGRGSLAEKTYQAELKDVLK
jgi:hypothetical protein